MHVEATGGASPRPSFSAGALVPPGATAILDVGCGTGDDVLALAELCGPSTLVIGLERRLELVDEAKRRARNVALNVRFAVGDERSLPFADASFDLVHSDALPPNVDDRTRVLRELVRVLRPGGHLVVRDRDKLAAGRAPLVTELAFGATQGDDLLALLEGAGVVALEAWTTSD